MFKVGDKVRSIEHNDYYTFNIPLGEICTISKIKGVELFFKEYKGYGGYEDGYNHHFELFELVSKIRKTVIKNKLP